MKRKQSPITKLRHIVKHDAIALNAIEQKGEIESYFDKDELEELAAGGFLTFFGTVGNAYTYKVNRSLLASTEVIEDPIDKEALKEAIKETMFQGLPIRVRWYEDWDQLVDDIVQVFYAQDPLEASHREKLSRMLYGHGTALWEDIFVQIGQLIEGRASGK